MMSQATEHNEQVCSVERVKGRVEIFIDGDKVVETRNAFRLFEKNLKPVIYVPRSSIRNIEFIKFSDYNCPHKGRAELYHVKHNSRVFENAAWSYFDTFEDVDEIRDLVAFYPGKVQAIKVTG
jgi:uncharacterized protein (DUF427 family)